MAQVEQDTPARGGLSLFKVAGIRLRLDYTWFIVFALVLFALSAGYLPRTFPGQDPQTYWLAGLVATLLLLLTVGVLMRVAYFGVAPIGQAPGSVSGRGEGNARR
uniref:Uncharacterized protein n=1 Tax=Desulfobacca acetoxidans TaxID=60893 RepID=A0A7V4G9K3_9BACT